jgi:hypothetical protein
MPCARPCCWLNLNMWILDGPLASPMDQHTRAGRPDQHKLEPKPRCPSMSKRKATKRDRMQHLSSGILYVVEMHALATFSRSQNTVGMALRQQPSHTYADGRRIGLQARPSKQPPVQRYPQCRKCYADSFPRHIAGRWRRHVLAAHQI